MTAIFYDVSGKVFSDGPIILSPTGATHRRVSAQVVLSIILLMSMELTRSGFG